MDGRNDIKYMNINNVLGRVFWSVVILRCIYCVFKSIEPDSCHMGCTVWSRCWPFPTMPITGLCRSPFTGAFSCPHLRMEAYTSSFSCLQAPQDFSEPLSALPFSCRHNELHKARLALVCGPEALLCRFLHVSSTRGLSLYSASPSAPGRPSPLAFQQCCPLPVL